MIVLVSKKNGVIQTPQGPREVREGDEVFVHVRDRKIFVEVSPPAVQAIDVEGEEIPESAPTELSPINWPAVGLVALAFAAALAALLANLGALG